MCFCAVKLRGTPLICRPACDSVALRHASTAFSLCEEPLKHPWVITNLRPTVAPHLEHQHSLALKRIKKINYVAMRNKNPYDTNLVEALKMNGTDEFKEGKHFH